MKERTASILIVCMFIIAIVITILFSTTFAKHFFYNEFELYRKYIEGVNMLTQLDIEDQNRHATEERELSAERQLYEDLVFKKSRKESGKMFIPD